MELDKEIFEFYIKTFLDLPPVIQKLNPSPLSNILDILEYSNSKNAKIGVLCKMMKVGSKNKPVNISMYKNIFLDRKYVYNIYVNKKNIETR